MLYLCEEGRLRYPVGYLHKWNMMQLRWLLRSSTGRWGGCEVAVALAPAVSCSALRPWALILHVEHFAQCGCQTSVFFILVTQIVEVGEGKSGRGSGRGGWVIVLVLERTSPPPATLAGDHRTLLVAFGLS